MKHINKGSIISNVLLLVCLVIAAIYGNIDWMRVAIMAICASGGMFALIAIESVAVKRMNAIMYGPIEKKD